MSRPFQPYSDLDQPARPDLNPDYYSSDQVSPSHHYSTLGSNSYPPESTDTIPKPLPFATDPASSGYSPVTAQTYLNTSYNNDMSHNVDSQGALWSAEKQASRNNKKKWLIIGGIVAVVVIAIGVGVGVATSHKSSKSSSASSSSSGSSSGGSSSGGSSTADQSSWVMSVNNVVKYNPKDLSQFNKDSRLIPALWGMAYTPFGAILPTCGSTFDQVLEDVYLMSQLTKNVRLYGTDCNATNLVLDAITQTKTNLSVYIGVYVDNNDTNYERQRDATKQMIQTYGTDLIAGITVGNEFILDNLTALNLSDPTSAAGISAAQFLLTKIADMRSTLSGMSLSKTIPVGNGDAGSYTNTQLLSGVDYFFANVHPWFGGLAVDQAAGWTYEFFEQTDVALANQTTNKPQTFIAEVGWPSNSSSVAASTDGPSKADIPTMQIFMNDWICQANANGTKWFWFENMDQPWKDALYGGVEGWWGLFNKDKQLKNVTIPNCPIA